MLRGTARRYRTTLWLCGFVIAGWLWDLALGGGRAHSVAWLGALVVVGGISALAARHSEQPPHQGSPVHPGGSVHPRSSADQSSLSKPPSKVSAPVIRPAKATEFSRLIEVEEAADKLFEVAGYGTTPGPATIAELAAAPLVLVACEPTAGEPTAGEPTAGDPVVGYARVEFVDGRAHLECLSVHPRWMRRGIGSALVRAVCEWATAAGYPELTLCTFAEVPWNGPFYAGLGFTELAELSPGLQALRATEQRVGLDTMGRRIVMIRQLGQQPSYLSASSEADPTDP